ncbi:MAG: hypothetical protein V1787_05625, partial [Candidatus Micrarchaeota archaeon]
TIEPPNAAAKFSSYSEETPHSTICDQMVSGIAFDCYDFAKRGDPFNPAFSEPGLVAFKCCDRGSDDSIVPMSACPFDKVLPGCSTGGFYVDIAVTKPGVYPYMPRIQAQDSAGNIIRAGAISDKDFPAPVTYPLFKYLDAAFYFNRYIAFGTDMRQTNTETPAYLRGIASGVCMNEDGTDQSQGCRNPTTMGGVMSGLPPGNYGGTSHTDSAGVRNDLAMKFFNDVVSSKACEVMHNKFIEGTATGESILDAQFCQSACDDTGDPNVDIMIGGSGWQSCSEVNGIRANDDRYSWKVGLFGVEPPAACEPPGGYCAYISNADVKINLVDSNPVAQVDPFSNNQFCWYSSVKYPNLP